MDVTETVVVAVPSQTGAAAKNGMGMGMGMGKDGEMLNRVLGGGIVVAVTVAGLAAFL